MTPSLSVATDNIYKFACLFGLALIISSMFAFVSTYTASLDRKIKYSETIIPLEAKVQRTKAEDELLAMNKKLIEVTKSNEDAAGIIIIVSLVLGISLSIAGAQMWYSTIQKRDDRLAALQQEKLELEIEKLRSELPKPVPSELAAIEGAENED